MARLKLHSEFQLLAPAQELCHHHGSAKIALRIPIISTYILRRHELLQLRLQDLIEVNFFNSPSGIVLVVTAASAEEAVGTTPVHMESPKLTDSAEVAVAALC